MFALRKDVKKLEKERDLWRNEFAKLQREWNILVDRINAKGGENFLRHGSIYPTRSTSVPFNDAELKKLLMLCHPDKHGGKETAVEMTKKINSLRKASLPNRQI